jgi:Coenzyme PQQ synthesis protein D (PqqD)
LRYRVSKSVLRASLEGEEVLLSTETDQYHVVNATGRAVIAEFDAGRSLEEAVETLVADTGKPAEKVRRDVAEFVQALLSRGLLETVDQA